MTAGYRHRADEWPFTEPPETPPPSLRVALVTPLRRLAGCWLQSQCKGCGNSKSWPIRMLLTERRERAEMPLQRAVAALVRCEKCGRVGCRLALVSDPRWRESQAAGKPPNWSLVVSASGSELGTVAFTEAEVDAR